MIAILDALCRRSAAAALALLVAGLPFPGQANQARDTLVIGMTQFPSTFHPAISLMSAKLYILAMAVRPVSDYGHDWKPICHLCVELPTLENGHAVRETLPDGSTGVAVTFRIHPDATWGDGVPVTSEDVAFTWRTALAEGSGFSARKEYERILDIEIIDDKTFTAHIDRLTFSYNVFSGAILPAHIEAKAAQEAAEYRNRTLYDTDPTRPGLWFGPYRITEVEQGSHVVLEPNPTWYGEAPHFRRIVVRVIENTAALRANLLSGAIDYVSGQIGFNADEALVFTRDENSPFDTKFVPSLVYEHIDFNLDSPYFRDPRVRRALMHAIDREAIVEALFDGKLEVAHSLVHPLDPGFDPEVVRYSHDPELAASLLDEAGWTLGPDGIRINTAGEQLSFPFMTTAGARTRELVQQVLQAQFRTVGVETLIRNEPARVFFGKTVTQRKSPGLTMYAFLSVPESVPSSMLRSDRIPSQENAWIGQNFPGYRNLEMDALLDALETELNPARRLGMWAQLQEIYATDLPAMPLYFRAEPYVMPKWLRGVRPTGHLVPATRWVEEWRVEE